MRVHISAPDGTPTTAKITTEEGQEINCNELMLHIVPFAPVTATLTLCDVTFDGKADAKFRILHPTQAEIKTVRSITFDDGEVWSAE